MTEFGKKIVGYAIEHDIPIKNLRKMSGVCNNTWHRAINVFPPTHATAKRICDGVGVDEDSRFAIIASAHPRRSTGKFISIRCADFTDSRRTSIKMILDTAKAMTDEQLRAMAEKFVAV